MSSSEQQLSTEAIREAKKGLVQFHRTFVADRDIYKEPGQVHYDISDALLKSKDNFAIEAFRESGKTELSIKTFSLYNVLFPLQQKMYIMIIKATAEEGEKRVKDIRDEILSNPLYQVNIKNINEKGVSAFDADLRRWNHTNEPGWIRIESKSKGGSLRGSLYRGRRPDVIIIDDPQDLDDMISETQMQKDWMWFNSEVLYLGRNARIFLIGNNLGANCIVEKVLETPEAFEKPFATMRIPARDDNGVLAWEEQWNDEQLDAEVENARARGALEEVNRELFCKSVADELRLFDRNDFLYFPPVDKKKISENCSIYMPTDLAISTKKGSDFTSIPVIGVDENNYWYVLDWSFGNYDVDKTVDEIFRLASIWRPVAVGIETVAFQSVMKKILHDEMRSRNIVFRVQDLKADRQKNERILALQPRFKQGWVWFEQGARYLTEIENELLLMTKTGTRAAHDDLADSLAYMDQMSRPPVGNFFNKKFKRRRAGGGL